MCKEGNCQWDLTYQQIIREQPALQDILPGARSSSQLRHKLVSITRWPKAEGLLLRILSELVWASVMHLSILWCIYLHYYSFLSLQRRTRAGFKQSLNLCTFSRNLVAAYTFCAARNFADFDKVLLSPVTAAYPRGASTADGMCHYCALFSPVLAFSGLLCRILWLKSEPI